MKKDILERLNNTVPTDFALYLVGDVVDEITWLRAENDRLRAKNEKLWLALAPFSDVAEVDIGEDEHDDDYFTPISGENHYAPKLRVSHFRAALAAITETNNEC